MEIIYTGMFDEVDVPYEEDGTPRLLTVQRGKAVEAPDGLAERLLEQEANWKRGTVSRGKTKESADTTTG